MTEVRGGGRRGAALLTVLWFTVALTAIAFALSQGVRAEFDRASLHVDSVRSYYLARGAIETCIKRIATYARPRSGDEEERPFEVGQRYMRFEFSSGAAEVEIVGESGKLDINRAEPDVLARLIAASGIDAALAVDIAGRIAEYRERLREREMVYGMRVEQALEQFGNVEAASSFRPVQASIQELEELLTIPGVTPELLYGSYRETEDGSLRFLPGLVRNLTTRGASAVEVNYASPELLAAAGLSNELIERIVEMRRFKPLRRDDFGDAGGDPFRQRQARIPLAVGSGSQAYTLWANAVVNDAAGAVRARRTVVARVERGQADGPDPIRISRWYDTPF